jgi:hypothetical protein
VPDVLAATASRFLDDACEDLGLADGVHEWLRASERELTVKVAIPGADGDVRVFVGTVYSTAACAAPTRAACASTTRSRSRRPERWPSS